MRQGHHGILNILHFSRIYWKQELIFFCSCSSLLLMVYKNAVQLCSCVFLTVSMFRACSINNLAPCWLFTIELVFCVFFFVRPNFALQRKSSEISSLLDVPRKLCFFHRFACNCDIYSRSSNRLCIDATSILANGYIVLLLYQWIRCPSNWISWEGEKLGFGRPLQ